MSCWALRLIKMLCQRLLILLINAFKENSVLDFHLGSSKTVLARNLCCVHFARYKNENSRSSQAATNMKRLLGFVSDVRMRYKLATDLNFRDLGTSILDGDAFLRDVMVP